MKVQKQPIVKLKRFITIPGGRGKRGDRLVEVNL